jgi:hypothetical protein
LSNSAFSPSRSDMSRRDLSAVITTETVVEDQPAEDERPGHRHGSAAL